MKIALFLSTLGIIAGSAHFFAIEPIKTINPEPTPLEIGAAPVSDSKGFSASTEEVYRNEHFTLQFSIPNPKYMGVVDPSGHFFYLVFPEEEASEGLRPIVESKKFRFTKTIEIDPTQLCGDPYEYGILNNRPVFTQSGVYTFIVGDNLHVDDTALISKVKINYHHSKR